MAMMASKNDLLDSYGGPNGSKCVLWVVRERSDMDDVQIVSKNLYLIGNSNQHDVCFSLLGGQSNGVQQGPSPQETCVFQDNDVVGHVSVMGCGNESRCDRLI